MKTRTAWLALVLGFAVLLTALIQLFRLRLTAGDVFPEYSSLRADPLGTRALYDSLAEIAGVTVARWHKPLDALPVKPMRTLLVPGLRRPAWDRFTWPEFDALNAAARAGSRVVVTFRADDSAAADAGEAKPRNGKTTPPRKPARPDRGEPDAVPATFADLGARWGVTPRTRWLAAAGTGAVRAVGAPPSLPSGLRWESDLFFEFQPTDGWTVLYRRGGEPVLIERPLGRGSLVLAADSYFLSNEALLRERPVALLSWLIGSSHQVTFDESHLGLHDDTGIAALARRYGLGAAFGTLLVLALLYAWQQLARFVPPPAETEELTLTYDPAAGLEALLHRAVPASDLVDTCLAEWRRTARAPHQARVDAALAALPPGAGPVQRYNAAVAALRHHGSLSR